MALSIRIAGGVYLVVFGAAVGGLAGSLVSDSGARIGAAAVGLVISVAAMINVLAPPFVRAGASGFSYRNGVRVRTIGWDQVRVFGRGKGFRVGGMCVHLRSGEEIFLEVTRYLYLFGEGQRAWRLEQALMAWVRIELHDVQE